MSERTHLNRPPHIGVLSDDLTGANGAAATLANRGLRSCVVWDIDVEWPPCDVLVADSRGRDEPAIAVDRAESWGAKFRSGGIANLEMRVDSTLRGQPAAEALGFMRGAGLDVQATPMIAVPAHPAAGRFTRDGCQRIENIDGETRSIDVGPVLFKDRPFDVVRISTIHQGVEAVAVALKTGLEREVRSFVLDSETADDLSTCARAVTQLSQAVGDLITLSSGAWLSHYPLVDRPAFVVGVIASPTPANDTQLQFLRDHRPDFRLVTSSQAERFGASGALSSRNLNGVVVETLSEVPASDPSLQAARVARDLIESASAAGRRCTGIVVSGGRAAAALVDELGAVSLAMHTEPEALCASGHVLGGPLDGTRILTKGGQIGNEQTLATLLDLAATPAFQPCSTSHQKEKDA